LSKAVAGYQKLIAELRDVPDEPFVGRVHGGLARAHMIQNQLPDARANLMVGLDVLQITSSKMMSIGLILDWAN
jgi:hypothetical protein